MMGGWQKPTSPPREPTWVDQVIALYMRDPDMEAEQFEALYDVALKGERPEHPGLPARLPYLRGLPPVGGMGTGGELR